MRSNELADKGYVAGCDHAMSIAEDGLHAVACLKSRWNASGFCFPPHLQGVCLLTRLSMEIMHVCRKDTALRQNFQGSPCCRRSPWRWGESTPGSVLVNVHTVRRL